MYLFLWYGTIRQPWGNIVKLNQHLLSLSLVTTLFAISDLYSSQAQSRSMQSSSSSSSSPSFRSSSSQSTQPVSEHLSAVTRKVVSLLAEQEQKETAARGQELFVLPCPKADKTPLDDNLMRSVLDAAPIAVHRIIGIWNQKEAKAKEEDNKEQVSSMTPEQEQKLKQEEHEKKEKGAKETEEEQKAKEEREQKEKEAKDAAQEVLRNFNKDIPKKWLLLGPAGTGKSVIGKAIAQECGMPFALYTASSIPNSYKNSGTQNLEKIFSDAAQLARSGYPNVIIIDELEVFIKQGANSNDTESGILTDLWTLLDRYKNDSILFIGTLNDVSKAPSPFKDRFGTNTIEIPLPDEKLRKDLIFFYMRRLCTNPDRTLANELAQKTAEFSHRSLEGIVQEARAKYLKQQATSIAPTKADYIKAIEVVKAFIKNNKADKKTWWEKHGSTVKRVGLFAAGAAVTGFGYYLQHKHNTAAMQQQKDQHRESLILQGALGLGSMVVSICSAYYSAHHGSGATPPAPRT